MSINHQALLDEDENNYISSYWNFGETKTRMKLIQKYMMKM